LVQNFTALSEGLLAMSTSRWSCQYSD